MHSTTAACCLSIVLDSSVFHTIQLSLFILDFLRQGTHQTVVHTTSLESHHPEDLPEPPSYVATVLSRSTFDRTEVSLSPLPVIAFFVFALQSQSPKVLFRSLLCSLSIPNSRRKVSYVLIFCFQGSQRYKITPSLYLPLSERVDNHKN